MQKLLSIREFYETRYNFVPDEIRNNLGHFNVFPLEAPAIGKGAKPLEYRRREWYNIVLVYGGGVLQCSDNEYNVKKQAIIFTNPYTPFGWEERDKITGGYYCIFNEQFVHQDKKIIKYPPFQTTTTPFYTLTDNETTCNYVNIK